MHLLERQSELETLSRCLQETRAGSGKLILIAGEAGIGKSSLVEQFALEHRREARVLWGACDPLITPRPLAPVREIAAQTIGLGVLGTDEAESHDRLFRALLEELSRHAGATSILVLEDLHWADEATLDFLRFIGRRMQRTSALLLATYRDEDLFATHPLRLALGELTGPQAIRLRLAPLSLAAVEVLARESGRDARILHEVTGGNPFFVREVLASPGAPVPETVRDAVLARLARCSNTARELTELVAISPTRAESWLIDAVLGIRFAIEDEPGVRGLLEIQSESVGFRHQLARLAVLGAIAPERARAMHIRVLDALGRHGADPARLVHHAALAGDAAAVFENAPLAATQAARLGAHREAAAHLSAALRHGVLLTPIARAELLERHALESALANQTRDAIASGAAAAAAWGELGNAEAQARALTLLAQEYRTAGDKAGADESVAGAIALLEARPRSAHLAMAYGAKSLLALNRGWNREALDYGQRALAIAREFADRAAESHALCQIGGALLGNGDRAGYEPLERSLSLALEHELEDHAARAYRTLQFYAGLIRDFPRAERAFHEGVEYCEERGIFSQSAYIRAYYTVCDLDRGRWADAARSAGELLHGSVISGVTQRVTVITTLALVRLRRGEEGADEMLDEALRLALPTGETSRIARVAAARAEQAWYRGDLPDIAREVATGLEHVSAHTTPWLNGELLFWQSLAGPPVIAGEVAQPYRLMLAGDWRAAADAWEHIGQPYERALALTEGGEDALREALAILHRLEAGPLAALVRQRLRELGARGVPRGPIKVTRQNPWNLTGKELEALQLLARGFTNAQLARRLHRSPKTVEHHVCSVLAKMGVHSRAEAVAVAHARGMISPRTP
ncbi:MAG TPA: AAA family ATPase [Steroidobacteraceae bacterium]|jgi:ATP/maltotriose-dependent transcriptional regulator MalT|nr:AAA family ATPase [Steroidobacteraceae bacterium]